MLHHEQRPVDVGAELRRAADVGACGRIALERDREPRVDRRDVGCARAGGDESSTGLSDRCARSTRGGEREHEARPRDAAPSRRHGSALVERGPTGAL